MPASCSETDFDRVSQRNKQIHPVTYDIQLYRPSCYWNWQAVMRSANKSYRWVQYGDCCFNFSNHIQRDLIA